MDGGKTTVPDGGQIVIPPGQLALLITDEVVKVPEDAIALISMKFGPKMRGLINVSGFHVDPGFEGRLKFSVYNAGSESFVFDPGQELFLIWFSDIDSGEVEPYDGSHNGQSHITAEDVEKFLGEVASPGELKGQIDRLNTRLDFHAKTFLVALGVVMSVLIIPGLKGSLFPERLPPPGQDASVTPATQADVYQLKEEIGQIETIVLRISISAVVLATFVSTGLGM